MLWVVSTVVKMVATLVWKLVEMLVVKMVESTVDQLKLPEERRNRLWSLQRLTFFV